MMRRRDPKDQYYKLFQASVAAIIVTTPAGRVVDCNDAFVRLFGFDSRSDVLTCNAWDFYFDRAERDALISSSRILENGFGEDRRFRRRDGTALWTRSTRVIFSKRHGKPELLLGTAIDISHQGRPEQERCRFTQQASRGLSPNASSQPAADESIANTEEIAHWLAKLNQALQPEALVCFGRENVRNVIVIIEKLKVLVQQLEMLRLSSSAKVDQSS